jgi:signal transduction histidine kinase
MPSIPPSPSSEAAPLPWRVALAGALGLGLVSAVAVPLAARAVGTVERAEANRRAETIAKTMAARLAVTPALQRATLLSRVQARSGTMVAVVRPDGSPLPDTELFTRSSTTMRPPSGSAVFALDDGERRLVVASEPITFESGAFVVLAAVPRPSGAAYSLGIELATLLIVLTGLGLAAAVIVARDLTSDVRAITARARRMSGGDANSLRALPVHARDEVGELVAAFNKLQREIGKEIEQHREALAKLEDAERRKAAQIATLRHELRTPLNSIIGFADLLLSGVDGELSESQREDIEAIARSGRHLLHLVDDVLDLSAIASGRFSIERKSVDLAAIVGEVVREAQGQARLRRISIEHRESENVLVEGDATSLRRAITNLVQNALQHCRGTVTVELEVTDREARVHVRDDGRGIRPQDMKRLFKPFERGREGGGTGLGLAITVALLELHEGKLGAESVEGQGSTFTAHVPLHETALSQAGFT